MLKFKDLMERLNVTKAKMGDVIKDFQDSDAPQFKGKSDKKRREMAIAAKLEADRGVKEEVVFEESKKLIKAKDNGSYPAHHDHITHDTYGDAGDEATSAHHKFASERAPVHTFKHEGSTHKIYHHPDGSTIHTMQHTHGHHGDDIAVYSGHHDPKHIEKQEKKHSNMTEELKGKQHKIDANKNGKVDGHDFKILRNAKKARYQ